jgi:hypothetical protein
MNLFKSSGYRYSSKHRVLCTYLQIFEGMFVQDKAGDSKSWGTHKLGLYGMGGLGKTTMCRALCRYFHEGFYGRVCHVELGSKPPLEQQKMVLTKLLRLSKEVVGSITSTHTVSIWTHLVLFSRCRFQFLNHISSVE